jgi:pimeloyl-ACP methyl ester carboxylesterase
MEAKWRRLTLLAAGCVSAIGVVQLARHLLHTGAPGAPPSAAAEGAGPTPSPEVFRLGHLTLEPCAIGNHTADGVATASAYCTRFSVPEDWDAPAGRRIELKIAIVTAQATYPDPDLVTFLDGGPGGAASDDYPVMAVLFEPLRQRRHVVLIDQRGTGGSNALSCPEPAQGSAAEDRPAPSGAVANDAAAALMRFKRCLALLQPRADVAHYTTTQTVRDLEAVRQALGAPPLNIIGISYGTRVAQQYARRYPQAVRALVLDGPVPDRLALVSEHARNLERALRAQFAACRNDPACAQRYGDPYRTLHRLRDALRMHPLAVDLRDPVSFALSHRTLTGDDLAAIVRLYAYNPASAALLPLMLQEAEHGNYAPLLAQKKRLNDDLAGHITSGMQLSVVCAEDAHLLSPRPEDEDTLLANSLITVIQSTCEFWPHERPAADFHAPLTSSLPTLVLAGELDPVTPPEYGSEILRQLPDARLLIVPGQGHVVSRVGCMPELVRRFIDEPNPGLLDATCLQRLRATPAFLNYNGAGP